MKNSLDLAREEMQRYGFDAELVIEETLPAFELRNIDSKIIIAAPNEVELLYGVYDFAERFGGWNFFEVGRDRFDESRRMKTLPEGIIYPAVRPLLKRRGLIQEFPFDHETGQLFDWMAKNKLNYLLVWMKYYDKLSPELKEYARIRGIDIESGHHNFNYWIPGSVYGKSHPEFFAEINGKRINPSGGDTLLLSEQLCTTNPELRREIVARMADYCAAHPEIKTISLIPNDGFGWCECENCSKFYDKNKKGDFYSVSEHVYKADVIYHDLLREVSSELQKVRPDIQVTFCAYINYCAPSAGFKLERGMAVHMAVYWRCINHTIEDEKCCINPNYARDIQAWCRAKNGGEVNIYEYFMGVNYYLSLPMLHLEEMFHEMALYSQWGVDGILTQFHVAHWSVYGINYRLMAQAARGEKMEAAIQGFFTGLFGGDAACAESFYREIKKMLLNAGKCHIPYPDSLLRRIALKDCEALVDMAQKLSQLAPADRFRKELVVWMEYLVRFKKFYDLHASGKAADDDIDELLDWIHSHSGSRVFVQRKYDNYFGRIKKMMAENREWVHFGLEWEDKYILRHRELL